MVKRILFVCAGNTCRSPMAEAMTNDMLAPEVEAESAGVSARSRGAANKHAIEVMKQSGLDISGHKPRHVSSLSLGDFDLIVALDAAVAEQLRANGEFCQDRLVEWQVADPIGLNLQTYKATAQQIKHEIESLRGSL